MRTKKLSCSRSMFSPAKKKAHMCTKWRWISPKYSIMSYRITHLHLDTRVPWLQVAVQKMWTGMLLKIQWKSQEKNTIDSTSNGRTRKTCPKEITERHNLSMDGLSKLWGSALSTLISIRHEIWNKGREKYLNNRENQCTYECNTHTYWPILIYFFY